MPYFKKGTGILSAVYKTDLSIGTATVGAMGKYLAKSFGLDAISRVDVDVGELPTNAIDFIAGNADVTTMVLSSDVTEVNAVFENLFPNLTSVIIGDGGSVVTGLDTAYANMGVTFYVPDTDLASYQAAYPGLTFAAYSTLVTFTIPYYSGTSTTLTADYVNEVIADLGTAASGIEKIIVPSYFTDYESGALDAIVEGFPALTTIMFGTGNQTFADLPWAAIREITRKGWAQNYFSLGDTKADVGTDEVTRTMRIIDFDHYGSNELNVEQMSLDASYVWNAEGGNNYSESDMRTTHLPAHLLKYSTALQAVIGETTYKVSTSGVNGTIQELTDKLFLGATKEYFGHVANGRSEEDVLTWFALYAANDTSAFRIKYDASNNARAYFTRSGRNNTDWHTAIITSAGGSGHQYPFSSDRVAPIFTIK